MIDDLVLCARVVEKSKSFQGPVHTAIVESLKSFQAAPSKSARITHAPYFQVPQYTIARPVSESMHG